MLGGDFISTIQFDRIWQWVDQMQIYSVNFLGGTWSANKETKERRQGAEGWIEVGSGCGFFFFFFFK